MRVIKIQKAPRKTLNSEDILAKFCFYYPQYQYSEAQKLPVRRVIQMLKIARKEDARRNLELVNIVAAPHTKNGRGVSKLIEYYQGIVEE